MRSLRRHGNHSIQSQQSIHPFKYGYPQIPCSLYLVKHGETWWNNIHQNGNDSKGFACFFVRLRPQLCPLSDRKNSFIVVFPTRILTSCRSKQNICARIHAAFHKKNTVPLSPSPGHRCLIILILLCDVVRLMTKLPCYDRIELRKVEDPQTSPNCWDSEWWWLLPSGKLT